MYLQSAMCSSFQLVEYVITVLFMCKFYKDWITNTQATLRTKSNVCFFFFFLFFFFFFFLFFFGIQGQVTPKWIVRSCRNLNSSESWCPLSATFIRIQSKLNRLCSGQGRIYEFSALRASNSKANWLPDLSSFRIRPRFCACPDYLHVS